MSELTEWDRDKCLELIDQYEKYPVLWNPKHGLYYNKTKKNDAWTSIDEIMGCFEGEAKRKMDSILSSFRREKGKGKKSVGAGKGRHKVYVSKWFAFSRLAFLLDRDEPRMTGDSIEVPDCEDESTESVSSPLGDNTDLTQLSETSSVLTASSSTTIRTSSQGRKRGRVIDPQEVLLNTIDEKSSQSTNYERDRFTVLGEHIGMKLRTLAPSQRIIAEKLINDVLFEAELNNLNRNWGLVDGNPIMTAHDMCETSSNK
ncbi:uncharacterized protein LOC135132768 [Zophobas morio]|uniref:uncharacterized protein LOC135132768 n=1 Tax=Zophobas morio TaxID=2755281 RepID=UPI00308280D4